MKPLLDLKWKKGFSLFEMILAVLLLTVAFVPLIQTLIGNLHLSRDLDKKTQALNLAAAKLEELRGTPYLLVNTSAKAAVPGQSGFSQTVTSTEENSGLKKISVTLYWTLPEGERSLNLSTYLASVESE